MITTKAAIIPPRLFKVYKFLFLFSLFTDIPFLADSNDVDNPIHDSPPCYHLLRRSVLSTSLLPSARSICNRRRHSVRYTFTFYNHCSLLKKFLVPLSQNAPFLIRLRRRLRLLRNPPLARTPLPPVHVVRLWHHGGRVWIDDAVDGSVVGR